MIFRLVLWGMRWSALGRDEPLLAAPLGCGCGGKPR